MKFIATVEKGQRANIDEIASNLKKIGVKVDSVLKLTGIITGSCNTKSLQDIKIKGIKSVEKDKSVGI
jgi:hypothetical protein